MTAHNHKLFTLGYKELTRVVCGEGRDRKEGIFYGGHDSIDIFIQCTSQCCKDKKPVDNSQGGSIWNCCQFEKHAGYGHRKKWKESIKTANNSVRILEFLKDKSKDLGGGNIVGHAVDICWFKEGQWYSGVIHGYDKNDGKYHVVYEDGDEEKLYLGIENMHVGKKSKFNIPNGSGIKRARLGARSKVRSTGALQSSKRSSVDGPRGPRSPLSGDSSTPATTHLVEEMLANDAPASPNGTSADTRLQSLWDGNNTLQVSPSAQAVVDIRAETAQGSTSGVHILNELELRQRYPQLQVPFAAADASRWLGMSAAERVEELAGCVEVKDVVERCPKDPSKTFVKTIRTYAKKAIKCGDCLGEMTGLVCTAGEVGSTGGQESGQMRLFESTVGGANGFSGMLFLDASQSANELNHIKQAPLGVGKPNVAAVEVYHATTNCIRMMVFALDVISPRTQLIMQACSEAVEGVERSMNGHGRHPAGSQQRQDAAGADMAGLHAELQRLKESSQQLAQSNQILLRKFEGAVQQRDSYRNWMMLSIMMASSPAPPPPDRHTHDAPEPAGPSGEGETHTKPVHQEGHIGDTEMVTSAGKAGGTEVAPVGKGDGVEAHGQGKRSGAVGKAGATKRRRFPLLVSSKASSLHP